MERRGESGEMIEDQTIYIILLVLFLVAMFAFVLNQNNSAGVKSEMYAKELVKLIDLSEVGDRVVLKVNAVTDIALDNEVPLDSVFRFDSLKREVCVRLATKYSCYSYFRDVVINDVQLELGALDNQLSFKIGRKDE
ncbi:MAG TPA: hypothetical protein VJK51_03645 [Candidatus Nanoarchaeia archaeon]|nr:hypothetical protein [Candidatus Nanoarchaeia archaeon]